MEDVLDNLTTSLAPLFLLLVVLLKVSFKIYFFSMGMFDSFNS